MSYKQLVTRGADLAVAYAKVYDNFGLAVHMAAKNTFSNGTDKQFKLFRGDVARECRKRYHAKVERNRTAELEKAIAGKEQLELL